MAGANSSKRAVEGTGKSLPKPAVAQQPGPVSSPSTKKAEVLTEGQEFYRAADILQAKHLSHLNLRHLEVLARVLTALSTAITQHASSQAFMKIRLGDGSRDWCAITVVVSSYMKLWLPPCSTPGFGSIGKMALSASSWFCLQARLMQAVSGEQQSAKDSYDRIYKRRSLPALRSSGVIFCRSSSARLVKRFKLEVSLQNSSAGSCLFISGIVTLRDSMHKIICQLCWARE